ncbi:hypothetical protein ACEOBW_22245 [Escherichia coli]|uniref:hypothetical protein n=1 Tax=Escherichia coli TaxID=562 RepID=UPI003570DE86
MRRFLKAGATRRDARRGRVLQGCYLAPDPVAVRNKSNVPRSGDFVPKAWVARVVEIEPPWHVHQQNSDKVAIVWK